MRSRSEGAVEDWRAADVGDIGGSPPESVADL